MINSERIYNKAGRPPNYSAEAGKTHLSPFTSSLLVCKHKFLLTHKLVCLWFDTPVTYILNLPEVTF